MMHYYMENQILHTLIGVTMVFLRFPHYRVDKIRSNFQSMKSYYSLMFDMNFNQFGHIRILTIFSFLHSEHATISLSIQKCTKFEALLHLNTGVIKLWVLNKKCSL